MKCRALLAGVLLLAACGSPQINESTALSVTVDSSGGVPVISVAGEAPVWTLDSLAVIRAEPTVGFSRVRSLALDPRGGIWVADVGENRLSYFGDDGKWIEDRGRVGSGPGEFRTPYAIAEHRGALLVHDMDNARIVRFALEGGVDTSWMQGRRISGDAMNVRMYPNADGPLLFDLVVDSTTPRRVYTRVGSSERILNPPRSAAVVDSKECMAGDAIHIFGSPFSPRQIVTAYGRGSVATEGGDYRLDIFDGNAVLTRTITRTVARDSVSQAEFDAENTDWLKYSEANITAGCRGDIKRYEFKPAIRALLPDADGRLWVERRKQGGFVYEVWLGDSLIAQVPAPDREEGIPPVMLGDRLAVVAESPDEGHEVRLYRIRKSKP